MAPIFAAAQTPVVSPGGVVDAASFTKPVVPGSLVSIFGTNLAAAKAEAEVIPLPVQLGGVSVTFNGIAAPLLYVSPAQINAQLPWSVSSNGTVSVLVNNGASVSAPQSVNVGAYAPALFAAGGYPVAINPDGSLAAPAGAIPGVATHPATPGDSLILLGSGFGAVTPAAITGDNSLDTLRHTNAMPAVSIAGVPAIVTFAGLSPQFVGVYQINVTVPSTQPPASAAPLEIQTAGVAVVLPAIAIGAGWPQWAQNAQHGSSIGIAGQSLNRILANITYDPLTAQEQAANANELLAHYQVPLVDGNDVYMEYKMGTYSSSSFAGEIWGEKKFTWQNGQLVEQWAYASDWLAPGSSNDFWEPVFHAALGNGVVYMPGAYGSVIVLNKADGTFIQRYQPFGTDPNTYETGPLTLDSSGNLFYNVIEVVVDPANGFYANDATNSWIVKITAAGAMSMTSYPALLPQAPSAASPCITSFSSMQLPWPPSTTAVPATAACGSQRAGLNVAPAVAPDGTIYTVSRAHFNARYAYLLGLNPDLSLKWAASLRNRFNDGCGVPVSEGGWLPPNGMPGGCSASALTGVDPATNQPGDGSVLDSASSSPVIAPDGSVLLGTWSRYNYAQGHLMHFDATGKYLGAFGFGWDTTPALYVHDGTWSVVTKNNHYNTGSYCDDDMSCPPDRNSNNPASPEQYFVTQLDANLNIEWSYQNTNTDSCTRTASGSLMCVSDHPNGFEWCVNSPAIDANGVVYANSEDGNLYAISQGGMTVQKIFQQLALGAAYTPASIGGDGRVYSQNDGILFVTGQ